MCQSLFFYFLSPDPQYHKHKIQPALMCQLNQFTYPGDFQFLLGWVQSRKFVDGRDSDLPVINMDSSIFYPENGKQCLVWVCQKKKVYFMNLQKCLSTIQNSLEHRCEIYIIFAFLFIYLSISGIFFLINVSISLLAI